MKRYLVIPGYVYSIADKQRHWIGFSYLCRLYQVQAEVCINYEAIPASIRPQVVPKMEERLIILTPRRDGRYVEHRRELELLHEEKMAELRHELHEQGKEDE